MKIKSLLHKSVEKGIIDESQSREILALNDSGSRPWLERLFDVALLIMPLSALGIAWHLSNENRIAGPIIALAFLAAATFANKLLNPRLISLHIVFASACGLLALSGTMSLSPTFVSDADIEVSLFATGALPALWVSIGRNEHAIIKVIFMIALVVSIASWIDVANSVNTIVSYLIVSALVFSCSLLPHKNHLTLAAQIIGSTFFMFSLLVFTLVDVDSDLISVCVWGLTIAMGLGLRSKRLTCVDNLPEIFIAAGALCMTGTIMSAVIDRIGFGIPVVALLLFMSLVTVVLVKKTEAKRLKKEG